MHRPLIAVAVAAALVPVVAAPLPSRAGAAPPTELLISEYVEGTSNNKALEIYNGTGAPIDLAASGYDVQYFFNGAATAGLTIPLTGTVADGDVYVLAQASASASILAQADQTNGSGWFNGDDAVVLRHGTTFVDVVGQVGVDPGTEWGSGLSSTADNTLRRLAAVCAGDTDGSDAFDPATQWTGLATDTFDGLGAHTAACAGDAAPAVTATVPTDGAIEVAVDADVTITFSEPVTVTDPWFTISCATTGSVGATVAGGPSTFTLDPAVDLASGESCTVTVLAAGVADQDVDDPPDRPAGDTSFTFRAAAPISGPCLPAPTITPISEVQGSGDGTPCPAGRTIAVEGVVVGDYEGPAPTLRGFYVQEQDDERDADPATSEGVFVFNGNADSVALGDVVTVNGTASEFQGQTQLTAQNVAVQGTGAAVTATEVRLPFPDATWLERVEGMLVHLPQTLSVTDTFSLGRFGHVAVSSGGRLPQPTIVAEPGDASRAQIAANDLNRIIVDDALQNQNPDPLLFAEGPPPFSASNTLRGGDTITDLVGVLTYTWGGAAASPNAYRVRPIGDLSDSGLVPGGGLPDFAPTNARPTAVPTVSGDLRIVNFNVLNYFLTLDVGTTPACGPTGFKQECRGANTAFELERQRTKMLSALAALDADVYGLIELENTTGVDTPGNVVAGLNALGGPRTYAAIETGTIGTDTIRVGIVYDTKTVSPIGPFSTLDSADDPRFDDDLNRPSLAQSFVDRSTGEIFTVVVNHLKSKGCDTNAVGPNADIGDGVGCWNAARASASEALVDWIASSPTGVVDDDVVVMGDFNSYAKEDPMDVFAAAGYVDLAARSGETYSYQFGGTWGSLDYALASPSFAAQSNGARDHHINADEPTVIDYNTEFKTPGQITSFYAPDQFRTSDHDPVLSGYDLDAHADVALLPLPFVLWPANHKLVKVTVFGFATSPLAPLDVQILSVRSSEADSGLGPNDKPGDIVRVDAHTYRLRAERFSPAGRTYTITALVAGDGQSSIETATVVVPRRFG